MDHHKPTQSQTTSRSSKTSYSTQDSSLLKDESNFDDGEEENFDQEYEITESIGSKTALKAGEYFYQEYDYVKPTQTAFDRKQIKQSKLFDKTKKITVDEEDVKDISPLRDPSILRTGFGLRNVSSFQEILRMSQEERERRELRKLWRDKKEQELKEKEREAAIASTFRSETTVASSTAASSRRSSADFLTQTETTARTTEVSDQRRQLDYLLGLGSEVEEEPEEDLEVAEMRDETEFKYSTSKSIREAQKYLRVHRIFECFQFIIAHMLSANAENPIEFILNILNKCLLYRSGSGEPPLLYEKKHIGQLFNLMDRLQTGFIDFTQYKTGMKTLGVCTYNENPDFNSEDLIDKDVFIEEAYEAELAIFNELIKRHTEHPKKKQKKTPSIFGSVSIPSINPPFFIPSELLFRQRILDEPQDYYEG